MKRWKKMRKSGFFVLFFVVLLANVILIQAGIIQTKNSKGVTTTDFFTSDEVYLKSTAVLCSGIPQTVDVYIINSGETILTDVRGKKQEINLTLDYQIPSNTKIWSSPSAGDYDAIIDCDKSGSYNPNTEPKTTFSVTFKEGSGKASLGKEIPDSSWGYDPEQDDLSVGILKLSLMAEGENILLKNMTISASGTGNDSEIQAIEVYVDENNNGKKDEGEMIIGDSQPAYSGDNGKSVVNLDYTLTGTKNILITYLMDENIEEGEFSLSVNSIEGIGEKSGSIITFSGLPISSNKITAMPRKTCLGTLVLEFPDSINEGENAAARISNLTGCDNKSVSLSINPCSYELGDVGSCILKDNSCQINLSSPENRTYYACIDKNNDDDSSDFGESVKRNLIIINPQPIPEENETQGNVSGFEEFNATNVTEENKTTITGGAIGSLLNNSLSSIFVILEITLLLILIVLIIISMRLKGRNPGSTVQRTAKPKPERIQE